MSALEILGGVLIALLTIPLIILGGIFSLADMPRYFRIKSM